MICASVDAALFGGLRLRNSVLLHDVAQKFGRHSASAGHQNPHKQQPSFWIVLSAGILRMGMQHEVLCMDHILSPF